MADTRYQPGHWVEPEARRGRQPADLMWMLSASGPKFIRWAIAIYAVVCVALLVGVIASLRLGDPERYLQDRQAEQRVPGRLDALERFQQEQANELKDLRREITTLQRRDSTSRSSKNASQRR